jgi:uncharacterized membrane protein
MEQERQSLKEEMTAALEEARTVLPGIQALFGFQTIAVFNARFEDLSDHARMAHLVALGFVIISIGLLMAPAAYHRIVEPGAVSRRTVIYISRLIRAGMAPLAAGLALEMFTVLALATDDEVLAGLCAGCTLAGLVLLWFVWPYLTRRLNAKARL